MSNRSRVSECFSGLAADRTTPASGSGTTPASGSANVHVLNRRAAARFPVEGARGKTRSSGRRTKCDDACPARADVNPLRGEPENRRFTTARKYLLPTLNRSLPSYIARAKPEAVTREAAP